MAIVAEHAGRRLTDGIRRFRAALAWLGLAMMLCLPGCGGCRKTPEDAEREKQLAEEKARKKEKEKQPFEARQPAVMPSNKDFAGYCKPGHWISLVWPEVKSNLGDFQGELQTEVVDKTEHRVPLVAVPYEMTNQRPAALAKEQAKSLESFTWIPPRNEAVSVNFKLAASGGGPAAIERSMSLLRMPSYRYYFVVLSKAVGRYEYLDKKLASIHLHRADGDTGPKYYDVVSMSTSRRPSLPTNALCWTSIAYLLWDDFDPAQLDVDQQRALVDWLHWGGQIIVSGPDALEQLQTSFLRPYLPASVGKARIFSAADLAGLDYWAGEAGPTPKPVRPWPGADLVKNPDRHAQYLDYTDKMLVERQVGRGRIVASAFRLTGPELTGWKGYDCFFNACLLRRPAREFLAEQDSGDSRFRWTNNKPNSRRLDAAVMTAVRYFSRDTGVAFENYAPDIVAAQRVAAGSGFGPPNYPMPNRAGNPVSGDGTSLDLDESAPIPYDKEVAPGLGAWNDFSPVAQAAWRSLDKASGIRVPERSFIVWVVVGYLCVLVPANWIVFRLIGRVEWAWIAAPLIAIAGTIVVIQQAQLNIGFARSQNQIAVIEMQAGYSRAHVARYTALYTSLATRYGFRMADPGGQIMPFLQFPTLEEAEKYDKNESRFQTRSDLVCRRGDDTQLNGFSIESNFTDYIHSEEMNDFGGTVALHHDSDGKLRVTNASTHPLENCRVVRGGTELATLGSLEPGATKSLKFEPLNKHGSAAAGSNAKDLAPLGELSVAGIEEVALTQEDWRPKEICLVAYVADDIPGLTVVPATKQTRQAALLVAHLDPGERPPPKADIRPKDSSLLGPESDTEKPDE